MIFLLYFRTKLCYAKKGVLILRILLRVRKNSIIDAKIMC